MKKTTKTRNQEKNEKTAENMKTWKKSEKCFKSF